MVKTMQDTLQAIRKMNKTSGANELGIPHPCEENNNDTLNFEEK